MPVDRTSTDAGQNDSASFTLSRVLANSRAWNIATRTAHIAAMGVLLGAHAFDVPKERLLTAFWVTLGTGAILTALEAGPHLVWLHQGRGLMTLTKLVLLAAIPWFWPYRFPILLVVVVLASVGSHMPASLRYYSVIYREILRCSAGPGVARIRNEE